jgi:hypothetical protein
MSELDGAMLEELSLRSRLNALVHERAEALREAEKLRGRSSRPDAEASLAETAERWDAVAERVSGEIDEQRRRLREQEAVVARLRADAAGA